ncbi:MAG: tetratricopeptide repeat protein [Paludibacteraceae bacterium]
MKKIIRILCFVLFGSTTAFAQWNTDRITLIGRNALANEDYVLAIQYFNQVIKVKPYLVEPYMYRAMAKISLDDFVGAEQDCNIAIERSPFIPQAFYTRGYARKRLGKNQEAIEDFDKALEFSPENSIIIINRADAKDRNKDYDGAISDLNYYQKLNPKEKSIDYEIGRILLSQNDTTGAIVAFDRFIENDTLSPLGYSVRAVLKMQMNDEDGAFADYNEAVARKSEYVGDFINRGILNVKRNRFNQALSDYNEAIRLDPKNTLAYYNRGLLRANLGDNNNAIGDLDKVVQADTSNYEARLQKAYLELTVGDLRAAEKDFQTILDKYPFFVPAYHGLAEAIEKSGKRSQARNIRSLAYEIENNKDFYRKKQTLVAKNQMAKEIQQNKTAEESTLTERFTARLDEPVKENRYGEGIRGNIQNNTTSLDIEKDFVLTYYRKTDELRQTNTYHPLISMYNSNKTLAATMKVTNSEVELVPDVLNSHFESINTLSIEIAQKPNDADLYFARAMDYALVQDFSTAIDDLTKAISIRSDFTLAYFSRANLRNKLIQFRQSSLTNNLTTQKPDAKSKLPTEIAENYTIDYEMILADLNRTIELAPDFSFAYFNKGNILFGLKNYKESLSAYNKAIAIDPDFAEAYFNRGITYIRMNDAANANLNISKAGELGIYQAYSILKRLQK